MSIPYIPPRSEMDPPAPELVVLFLEAVARVTPAFQELRERALPRCDFSRNYVPLDDLRRWWARWHLDFENCEAREMAESWTVNVLRDWAHDPAHAAGLKVDCGWWEHLKDPRLRLISDRPILAWNPDREPLDAWNARSEEMVLRQRKRLEQYGAESYQPETLFAFEYLALRVCCALSDVRIAEKCGARTVTPESVKKARTRLAKLLHI